jgi:hydroxylamine dehydrogenase
MKHFMSGIVALLSMIATPGLRAAEEEPCLGCHGSRTPGIVSQWKASRHFEMGVSCLDCHEADAKDPDAFKHGGHTIAVLVTPKDCSRCHEKEVLEQQGSHHAKAGRILGSLDNLLGEVVGGIPAVNAGCRQCHGSQVKIGPDGKPTADTWPNTGMGRLNPDGSMGSCSACHARHEFSKAQARQPEACGKCHLGPDHPQIEVWNESKHGVMYHADREKMNLGKDTWVAGKDYFSGPTCASCHMGAAGGQHVTHDVGERISWTLRPAVSQKLNMVEYADHDKDDLLGESADLPKPGTVVKTTAGEKKVTAVMTWKDRRANMQEVCRQCHDTGFVKGAYTQFDDVVNLYDDKFARPGKAIMDELRKAGRITPADFDDPIEWTWYEIWHHQGRRARHGAAMQGPDYTWWHGLYEVSKAFYEDFIPQVKQLAGPELSKQILDKYLYSQEGHLWYRDGLSKDALEKIRKFYEERYKQ